MTEIRIINDGESLAEKLVGTVATIGVFDGVHLGHQALFKLVVNKAKELDLTPAVITFDQHPTKVTSPDNAPKTLTKIKRKLELFQENGIEYVYLIKFNQKRSETSAKEFFREVFVAGINAKYVYVGEDFQFGYRKEGDVNLLRSEGEKAGIEVSGIPLIKDQTIKESAISSTAIRMHLQNGEMALANKKLGRMYEYEGKVIEGDGRGSSIGFPTANLGVDQELAIPAEGVYAAWFQCQSGAVKKAAVNIGRRPTFKDDDPILQIEAHLLNFDGDLYGQLGRLSFVQKIREEKKFKSLEEFQGQLRADLTNIRSLLENS